MDVVYSVVSRVTASITLLLALLLIFPGAVLQVRAEGLPELVITELVISPAQPYAGDVVTLSAVVKNQGTAATPDGVAIGGVFFVNGQYAAYTDNTKTSLAPGASVTVTANGGGPFGNGTWVAQVGTHTISFLVDDINRIPESDETNNTFAHPPMEIALENGPDLIVSEIGWRPPHLIMREGKPVIFTATVKNRGTQPIPANTVIQVNFAVNGQVISIGHSEPGGLEAGQSLTVVGGPVGPGPWFAVQGQHKVTAIVDPNGRLEETHEENNTTSIDFAIAQDWTATAQWSDSFVDTVGINMHLGYLDTTYGQYETIVKPMLQQLGIRHIRDGGPHNAPKIKDLATLGIKTNYIMGPGNDLAGEIAAIKSTEGAIVSIEGPNEPDIFYPALWPDGIRQYQAEMYDAMKADPELSHLPVMAPSLANAPDSWKRLGAVACDMANVHVYESYPGVRFQEMIDANTHVCPNKKGTWITETGYHTALKQKGGVTETAQGKYVLRAYLLAFLQGIERTFYYEFLEEHPDPDFADPEQHFGIVHTDGTPKPAYTGLKNLLARLGDPGDSFTPDNLPYQVSGNITNLRHLLLQKRDGTYQLVLWQDVPGLGSDGKDLTVTPQSITLDFEQRFSQVNTYQPLTSADALSSQSNRHWVSLEVTDSPLVIELKP